MTAERWGELKRIFNGALDLLPEQRAGYLDSACNGDGELRREVENLLQEHEQADQMTSPLRNANMIGQTIAHYRILARLGRGGMGIVYKGEDVVLGRAVALKFVAPEVSHVPEARARFLREAMAASAVIHPNLCTLLEVEEHQGQLFLVMNFVDGQTLRERLAAGPLEICEALRIAAETASGLQALHSKGIIHRDIKSSNIMLESGGRAVITDFGIASVEGQERITRTGGELGTVAYMAPEVLAGGRPDARSDIWSLGVVLFEMLTGQPPFRADNQAALAAAIQNEPPLQASMVRAGLPEGVTALLDRLLAKDPARRFQSADELEQELRRVGIAVRGPQSTSNATPQRVIKFEWSPRWSVGKLAKYALIMFVLWRVVVHIRARHLPPPPPAMATVPETSYSGSENSAIFSPDGRQIAFTWQDPDTGKTSVCIKMVSDEGKVCLASGDKQTFLPAWSPDGRWIAYLRAEDANTFDVVLSSPIGGPERVLGRTVSGETIMSHSRMAWMPNSRALILSDGTSGVEPELQQKKLWKLSIDTLERTPLSFPPPGMAGDRSPAVSADGKWLAYVRETHMTGEIAVVPLDEAAEGKPPEMITSGNHFILDMAWNPSGTEIVYAESETLNRSDFRLWRVGVRDGEKSEAPPARIEEVPVGGLSPAFSPDGHTLLYTLFQNDQNVWRMDRESIHSPWQGPRKFNELSSTRDDAYPSYSPDGRRLSFVSNRSGPFELWVSNSDGSNPRQLTNLRTISGTSTWSPDSKQIAFDWNTDGNWDAYVINAEGGTPRRMTTEQYDETSNTWSRDGRFLYVNSNQSGRVEIWRVPATGGVAEQITHLGGVFGMETPDGKTLIYSRQHADSGPLYQMDLSRRNEQLVLDDAMPICFFVTARGIYYFRNNPDSTNRDSLYFFDFATRKSEFIFASTTPVGSSLTVSPDERTILFTLRDQIGSDILRIENFR